MKMTEEEREHLRNTINNLYENNNDKYINLVDNLNRMKFFHWPQYFRMSDIDCLKDVNEHYYNAYIDAGYDEDTNGPFDKTRKFFYIPDDKKCFVSTTKGDYKEEKDMIIERILDIDLDILVDALNYIKEE